jgi:hypothetical protein
MTKHYAIFIIEDWFWRFHDIQSFNLTKKTVYRRKFKETDSFAQLRINYLTYILGTKDYSTFKECGYDYFVMEIDETLIILMDL